MKLQEEIVAMLNDGLPLTRGKLCVSAVRKSGRKAYNLQYRRKTVQFVMAIPADELEAYMKSTERCRRFLDCVQRYVDMKTRESIKAIRKEAKAARGKADRHAAPARMQGKTIGA